MPPIYLEYGIEAQYKRQEKQVQQIHDKKGNGISWIDKCEK